MQLYTKKKRGRVTLKIKEWPRMSNFAFPRTSSLSIPRYPRRPKLLTRCENIRRKKKTHMNSTFDRDFGSTRANDSSLFRFPADLAFAAIAGYLNIRNTYPCRETFDTHVEERKFTRRRKKTVESEAEKPEMTKQMTR